MASVVFLGGFGRLGTSRRAYGTCFYELLEYLQSHLAHRGGKLGRIFLQLLDIAHSLHRLGHRIDIDVVRRRNVGQAHESPRLFRRAVDFDIHFHAVIPSLLGNNVARGAHFAMNSPREAVTKEIAVTDNVRIEQIGGGKDFAAYVAQPAGTGKAAIVVIQEIFGVNAGIRRKCDLLAEDGYLAVAPDLFWQLEPGIELDPDIKPEFQKALQLMEKFDQDEGVRDIEATIKWTRGQGCGKVGAVGYCLGGRLAYMTAARTDSDATVGYYAVGVDNLLREKHAIANPLMLHIPTEDGFVDKDTQKAMHEGLDDHPKVTLHDYEGMDHGFATQFGKRRNKECAELADRRTTKFFARHLA